MLFRTRAVWPCFVAVLALISVAAPAAAQLFRDWGGGNEVGASGKEIVRFDGRFEAGQIVVSFSDRRLYLITRRGEAISYPIAVPREEDRWEGFTKVPNKRVNPSWTPTPSMVAENPRLQGLHPHV